MITRRKLIIATVMSVVLGGLGDLRLRTRGWWRREETNDIEEIRLPPGVPSTGLIPYFESKHPAVSVEYIPKGYDEEFPPPSPSARTRWHRYPR